MDGIEPGWHADPSGRHELRYWNGSDWTDHVSDGGITSVDPLAALPVAATHGSTTSPKRRRPWALLVLALVVAAGVAAALVTLVGGGDSEGGDPFGTRRLSVGDGGRQVAIVLDLEVGQAIRYRAAELDTDRDLDLALLTNEDVAVETAENEIFDEAFSDVPADERAEEIFGLSGAFSDEGELDDLGLDGGPYFDIGVPGFPTADDGEAGWFAPLVSGRYYLVLADRDDEDATFVVTIEEWGQEVELGETPEEDADQFSDAFFTDEEWFGEFDRDDFSE